jgi:glycolate oxidase iron-sulfur subunit
VQHDIPPSPGQPQRAVMAGAVATCVHCGFCLPACPTYKVLGEEMDSPRGRIVLMKQVLEGTLAIDEARPHIDRCLGCMACVSACPSGVPYGELLVPFRAETEPTRSRWQRLRRKFLLDTLESPSRFRASARLGKIAQRFSALAPAALRPMLALLPARVPGPVPLPPLTPAIGPRRARVALLAGCAQQVLAPEINLATIDVLAANGIEVVVPGGQGCCGALALHVGEDDRAYDRATTLARAMPDDVDAIVTNAAGCGSAMKEYGHAFRGRGEHDALAAFGTRVRDVSELLDDLGLVDPPTLDTPRTVAYHDACHLAHAQGIRRAPRALLERIGNLRVVEIPDGDTCCGSAGLYNVEQPAIADDLGGRKAAAVQSTGADMVAAGNIGCLVQIQTHLARSRASIPVLHTMQVLQQAYKDRR